MKGMSLFFIIIIEDVSLSFKLINSQMWIKLFPFNKVEVGK